MALRVFCEMGSWFKPICHGDFPWTLAFVRQGEGILRYFKHAVTKLGNLLRSLPPLGEPTEEPQSLIGPERFATWVLGSSLYATAVSHGHCVSQRWAKAS